MIPNNFNLSVGNYVECCLDTIDIHDNWYTGKIVDIDRKEDRGYIEISIERDDNRDGVGMSASWRVDINEETQHYIKILRKTNSMLDFKVGDIIDIPENLKTEKTFENKKFPMVIESISPCGSSGDWGLCEGCPGKINGLCFGYSEKLIAFKIKGDWDNAEN